MSALAKDKPQPDCLGRTDCSGRTILARGPATLRGTVQVGGAKNSVLKLMAATLLAEGTYQIANVPQISDVLLMTELLGALGCEVTLPSHHDQEPLLITVPERIASVVSHGIADRFRASVALLGPMLARHGEAVVALPGGDDFGARPIDMHLGGLASLGVEVEIVDGCVQARAKKMRGATIRLDFPSVGATENLLMAAVGATGTTVIDNAAREPEVVDLCDFLTKMGARISGSGTNTLRIEGGNPLSLAPADHSVVGDRIVAATFLAAVGIAGGEVTVKGVNPAHLGVLCGKLRDMGMAMQTTDESITAVVSARLRAAKFSTLPYPGVATDLKPFLVALLATADGVGSVTENLFAQRFRYVNELRLMGADIRIDTNHVVVEGQDRLQSAQVTAHDIRAGAALVIAALGAQGETSVLEAQHIARGYDDLAGQLRSLGAEVRETVVNRH